MDKNKKDDQYFIDEADKAINELVYDKVHLVKAYNYYSGVRDTQQFKHLEENYGLGNPTSITFIPLIRKHIDALIGEFMTLPIEPKISCKDSATLNNIFREKQLAVSKSIADLIKTKLDNLTYSLLKGDGKNKISDAQFAAELREVEDWVDNNFVSNYEMASQNIVNFCLQDRNIDFKNKLKLLIIDLFIAGEMYYRVEPTSGGSNISIKVLNPLNTFVDKNVNSIYINDAYRTVVREYLSLPELMVKYGAELTEEDLADLTANKQEYTGSNLMIINATDIRTGCVTGTGLDAGHEVTPLYNGAYPQRRLDLYPVYEVEFKDFEKINGKMTQNRYSVVRIGTNIYIPYGLDKHSNRSIDSPTECKLNTNGLQYMTRTGQPYSLVLATADLQDKYDILHFFKENAIAQSGTAGSWVDLASIPVSFGATPEDRLIKWIAYKKSGLAVIDTTQDGANLNTIFQGYDDTVKHSSIQAIQIAIQDIEDTATSITGVFRERIGGIQQRDAVANVAVGMQQSFIITKQYHQAMDLLTREILLDCLNLAKRVYKKGLKGVLILGENRQRLFTALPEHFLASDIDVHLADSQEIMKERDLIKQLTVELMGSGAIDPEILIAVSTSKSLTEMKIQVSKSMKRKKEENDQLQQISQQAQEAQKQLQEMQKELQKAQQKIEQLNEQKIQVQQEKVAKDYEVGIKQLTITKEKNDAKAEQDKRRVELEALQLVDQNPKNDEIRNE